MRTYDYLTVSYILNKQHATLESVPVFHSQPSPAL